MDIFSIEYKPRRPDSRATVLDTRVSTAANADAGSASSVGPFGFSCLLSAKGLGDNAPSAKGLASVSHTGRRGVGVVERLFGARGEGANGEPAPANAANPRALLAPGRGEEGGVIGVTGATSVSNASATGDTNITSCDLTSSAGASEMGGSFCGVMLCGCCCSVAFRGASRLLTISAVSKIGTARAGPGRRSWASRDG